MTVLVVTKRSRVAVVAAALVLILEGGGGGTTTTKTLAVVDAFVLPSSSLTATSISELGSFKFIKGETTYGDIVDGSVNSGMLGGGFGLGGTGGTGGGSSSSSSSLSGFGGNSRGNNGRTSNNGRMGTTNSLASRRNNRNRFPSWWSEKSGFSRSTPTTQLAAGSVESWPVMEADDIQILVRKGDDDDQEDQDYQDSSSSSSVRATLERWERDLSLQVVGRVDEYGGYPMLGNEMQPQSYNNGQQQQENNNERTMHAIHQV